MLISARSAYFFLGFFLFTLVIQVKGGLEDKPVVKHVISILKDDSENTLNYKLSKKDFLILTQPRSHSTLFVELLNDHLNITTAWELLNPIHETSYTTAYNILKKRTLDKPLTQQQLAEALRRLYIHGWTDFEMGQIEARDSTELYGFKLFGLNIGYQSIADLLKEQNLVSKNKYKIIHLIRPEFFLAGLSLYEAVLDQQWVIQNEGVQLNTNARRFNLRSVIKVSSFALQQCLESRYYEADLRRASDLGLASVMTLSSELIFPPYRTSTLIDVLRFLTGNRTVTVNIPQGDVSTRQGRSKLGLCDRIEDCRKVLRMVLYDLDQRRNWTSHEYSEGFSSFPEEAIQLEYADCVESVHQEVSELLDEIPSEADDEDQEPIPFQYPRQAAPSSAKSNARSIQARLNRIKQKIRS